MVLLSLLREPVRVEPVRFGEALERRLVCGGEHDAPFGNRVALCQREIHGGDVRHKRRRRPVPDHLTRHRLRVLHLPQLLRRYQSITLRRPYPGDLLPDLLQNLRVRLEQSDRPEQRRRRSVLRREEEIEKVSTDLGVAGERRRGAPGGLGLSDLPQRVLHPEIDQARRLLPVLHHPPLAVLRARPERLGQPVNGEPGVPERRPGEINGQLHEPNVEQEIIMLEPLSGLLAQIRAHEHSLRSLQVHVPGQNPERNRVRAILRREPLPYLEVLEDNNLLQRGVRGQRLRGEIGGDPTAEIFVLLARHVDEIVLAEELLPEGMAHETKRIGSDIGEDLVRELGVADEEDEVSDDVVGGDSEAGRLGES